MKIVRFTTNGEVETAARLGVVLADVQAGDLVSDQIGDLDRGFAQLLAETGAAHASAAVVEKFPTDVGALLAAGDGAMTSVREAADFLAAVLARNPTMQGLDGHALFTPLGDCHLYAPVRPSKIIAVGRNYRSHNQEMSSRGGKFPNAVPSAWIKANSCINDPFADVLKPRVTKQLDYETELTAVIGIRCQDVPADRAYEVIAGYTVMADITARDVVRTERAEGNQLLGKMFNTFAPMGPWFVTADEIDDPMKLPLRTRVNGEVRQDSNTAMMIWSIPQLIAYLSQMTLEPGDLIMTGTPSGVAMGHKVEGENWFLNDGDQLECEVEGVGCLRYRIIDDSTDRPSWSWGNEHPYSGRAQ